MAISIEGIGYGVRQPGECSTMAMISIGDAELHTEIAGTGPDRLRRLVLN